MKIKKTIRKWVMLSSVILFPWSLILVIAQQFTPAIDERWLIYLGPKINPFLLLAVSSVMLFYTCIELQKKCARK